jgi:hypothetical protein
VRALTSTARRTQTLFAANFGPCDPCQSDRYFFNIWLIYTPELALSSPLPLVVSLWLMMTTEDRMLLVFPAANEHAHRRWNKTKAWF